jgi:hypothetical protein
VRPPEHLFFFVWYGLGRNNLIKDGKKKKTFQSPFKEHYKRVKEWADRQESMGHELSADDLLEEFQLSLEATVFEMEDARDTNCGFIDEKQQVFLALCKSRLETIDKPGGAAYAKKRLMFECKFVQRNPSNVVPFTEAAHCLVWGFF